jgi:hypothetical protein
MSYKKWIYKYKYLLAEQDEIEERFSEYASEFNKVFKRKEEPSKEKKKSNIDWDSGAEDKIEDNEKIDNEEISEEKDKTKKEPKKGRELYKKISKEVHPDKGGNEKDFKIISELYHEGDILGMYLKAEELGVELEDSDLGDAEENFELSCASISEKNMVKMQTLAWVWAKASPEKRKELIIQIKNTYNLEYIK